MTNAILNKAKKEKNDEFYTLRSDVEEIFNNLDIDLSNYVVDLPFDCEKSHFYKYCKDNNINVNCDCKKDYKNFKYSNNGVVISNPPFSILREMKKNIILQLLICFTKKQKIIMLMW